MTAPPLSILRRLHQIIGEGINTIETSYSNANLPLPDLNDPSFSSPVPTDSAFLDSTNLVIAAAYQLIANVRRPADSLVVAGAGQQVAFCLGVAEACNIPEILDSAGPAGLHKDEIAKLANTDAGKIGRILRLLCTVHIFKETSPDVYANNRISAALSTGKTFQEIQADPNNKHNRQGDLGTAALLGHYLDEVNKVGAHLREHMTDPKLATSTVSSGAPFQSVFGCPIFEWYSRPENELPHKRFGAAMKGAIGIHNFDAGHTFDWASLSKDSVVVDVGGGIGSSAMVILKAHPHLRVVVQDLEATISDGQRYWSKEHPTALADNRALLQTHNFFSPQPTLPTNTSASVFFLRYVAHNWPSPAARTILYQLRKVATPTTKMVIMENIAPYATSNVDDGILVGEKALSPPEPLLANLGAVNLLCYNIDMHMLLEFNSQVRTVGEFIELARSAGWKLEDIKRAKGGTMSSLIFGRDEEFQEMDGAYNGPS